MTYNPFIPPAVTATGARRHGRTLNYIMPSKVHAFITLFDTVAKAEGSAAAAERKLKVDVGTIDVARAKSVLTDRVARKLLSNYKLWKAARA